MVMTYWGPYAEAINATVEHEGYADRRMADGSYSNGVWSAEFPPDGHVAFVAACGCGWRSTVEHPPTEQGERAAEEDFDHRHLRPMIEAEARRHTFTGADLLTFIDDERRQLNYGDDGRLLERSRGRHRNARPRLRAGIRNSTLRTEQEGRTGAMTELRTDGPHSPDYTREVADTLAQAARVLAHATRGSDGLVNPSGAYDLAGTLTEACRSLEQTLRQTAGFLDRSAESPHLREDSGRDPASTANLGASDLRDAATAANGLTAHLDRAQQIISGLAAKPGATR